MACTAPVAGWAWWLELASCFRPFLLKKGRCDCIHFSHVQIARGRAPPQAHSLGHLLGREELTLCVGKGSHMILHTAPNVNGTPIRGSEHKATRFARDNAAGYSVLFGGAIHGWHFEADRVEIVTQLVGHSALAVEIDDPGFHP